MGWRTIQVPRAGLLVEQVTVPNLLQAIQKKDKRTFTDLKTPDGVRVFDHSDATSIIEKLSQKHVQHALERCEVHDLPKLIVTKRVDEGGKARYVPRDFGRLSLGQQQSVLLALILCSSGNHPLILDQPEDNLDGEFIYHTLVPVLRRAKERRQIVVVTHNANIAVLGDAELIVALKSGADKGMIICRGSIDHEGTRDEACKVLEGAKEAFQRRARTYGFRLMPS
jgi:ABC-type Mn2+/Zn2+ transport system ATPase subunit